MAYIKDETTGKLKYVADDKLMPTAQPAKTSTPASISQPAKSPKNNFTSDNLEVRSSLGALGFDDSKIDWDGKNVTYDGQALLTPERNDNGVTKTTANNLIKSVNNSYKTRGINDSVVDVTSYAAGATQLQNAVTYDNGIVSLAGVPIENTVIIDGVAYAPKSAIDKAVKSYSQNMGTYSKKAKEYLDSTESIANHYAEEINNYKPFSYNPEEDPAYIAYRDAYTRNAQKALDDTYGRNTARTGGYANTAAISAGNQAYYNHMSELADRIPQLMDNAYDRYINDYSMLFKKLNMYGTPYDRYNLEADALKLDTDAAQKAFAADYERDVNTRKFNYDAMLDDRDYAMDLWEQENISMPKAELSKLDLTNEYKYSALMAELEYKIRMAEYLNKLAAVNKAKK